MCSMLAITGAKIYLAETIRYDWHICFQVQQNVLPKMKKKKKHN